MLTCPIIRILCSVVAYFFTTWCVQELEKSGIDFIVAPYEADSQLAYLEKIGLVSAILTEDSDLLVFGCNRVSFLYFKILSVCNPFLFPLSFNVSSL